MLPGMQLSNQKVNCAQISDVRVWQSLQITSYSSLQSPEIVVSLNCADFSVGHDATFCWILPDILCACVLTQLTFLLSTCV